LETYQKILLDILKASIDNEKVIIYNTKLWNRIFEEACNHKIPSLIYYTLDKRAINKMEDGTLKAWKREVFFSNVMQIKFEEEIKTVLLKLKIKNIKVILLKGVVLRGLYPKTEFRTMGDVDILIRPEDYKSAKECLESLNYEESESRNNIHYEFKRSGYLEIEVHTKIINNDFIYENFNEFHKQIWEKSIKVKHSDIYYQTLCNEDFLLHLCFHMAIHTKLNGFGLRQLYDLAIFVKSNLENIDWIEFEKMAYKYKILKYSYGLMLLIEKIFNIKVIKKFKCNINIKERSLELLVDNIFKSGVYGKKLIKEEFSDLYKIHNNHKDNEFMIKKLIRFIFPKRYSLINEYGEKYLYLNKSIIFLPKAWINRIFYEFFKKYKLSELVYEINKALNIIRIRRKIINIFEIPS
jgi:hypothetical protein